MNEHKHESSRILERMSLRERKSRGDPPQCGGSPLLLIRMEEHKPLAVRNGARREAGKERRGPEKPGDRG
jgi:hypothetical protein